MQIYNYDKQTGEYISSGEARLDPIEGKPMIPGAATAETPPEPGTNQVAVYNGGWSLVPDHRGETWWRGHADSVTIEALGEVPDPAWTEIEPEMPLGTLRDRKLAEINGAASAATDQVRSAYPAFERESWDQQASEADKYLADTTQDAATVAPLLSEIATARGVSVENIANRVQTKRAQFVQLAGATAGKRQKLEEQIEAAYQADDRAALEAITWA